MMKPVRVLWVSRHPPCSAEKEELRRVFGESVMVIHYSSRVRDAQHVLQLKEMFGADEVVVILPPTIVKRLCEIGLHPIIPEVEQVDDSGDFDFEDKGHRYRFRRFVRVEKVEVRAVPLEPRSPAEGTSALGSQGSRG
ncbi:MAG: hypothetical protein QXI90_05320 [Thermofilum sp.]